MCEYSKIIRVKQKIIKTSTIFLFDYLYVKLSRFPPFSKRIHQRRQARYLSIQIQYNVHKRLNNVHKRLTEARFRVVTMTSTNCIKYKTVVVVKNITHLSVHFNNTKISPITWPSCISTLSQMNRMKCHEILIKCTY